MKKFVIQPHFRLQEWVADEKGGLGTGTYEQVIACPLQSAAP
ncbi:MAG TPA: hypothetical protein VGI32_14675 [Steroidobacteraceae bacterium]|jgi:hypothetical protein